MRAAFVIGVVLAVAMGSAIYDGRADDAAKLAVFGLMSFGAVPVAATWPE
jgi:hypothetical protein